MPDMLKVIVGMCKLFHVQVIDLSQRFLETVSCEFMLRSICCTLPLQFHSRLHFSLVLPAPQLCSHSLIQHLASVLENI